MAATSEAALSAAAYEPVPQARSDGSEALLKFDPDDLRSRGFFAPLISWALDNPQWWLGLLRRVKPIAGVGNWVLVTRFDDVQEVLGRQDVFRVPWGEKVKELNGGPNFLLGMEADDEYWRIQKQVMASFRFEDVAAIVSPLAARLSTDIVARCSERRLDAIEALITRVPTLICEQYYGVTVAPKGTEDERKEFAVWSIALSTYTFGDTGDDPHYRRAALAASQRLRLLVDNSIKRAKSSNGGDGVLGRLIALQKKIGAASLSDDAIRATLIGMITGFVPTNTMAAGHILDVLLRRPDLLAEARAAALAGDDDLLKRCLFEASRFKPINIGPFRRCHEDCTLARGTGREFKVRKGMTVFASTQSAMFDQRRVKQPHSFDPNRPASDYMLFGHGLHWCVGAFIAEAQITQTMKALLVKRGLRPAAGKAGRLQRLGQFPAHLWVEFDPDRS